MKFIKLFQNLVKIQICLNYPVESFKGHCIATGVSETKFQ
jgi:hypothetical protein